MQDLGGQVRREGAEGEVSPILPSPGPRRAAACWQRRERSGRHRLGECLICGIPQIIRAAGNVGQGWRIPSPASAPDAAGGRKGSGREGNPGASLSCPPQLLPGPRAPPSSAFGGLLERRSSGSCPPLCSRRGQERRRAAVPGSRQPSAAGPVPGIAHVRFPNFTHAFLGSSVPPHGRLRVRPLPAFAEIPAASLAAEGWGRGRAARGEPGPSRGSRRGSGPPAWGRGGGFRAALSSWVSFFCL